MKSINKIIILLLLLVAIAGCDQSFLDRPSQSQISANNFYQTTTDIRLATASLYGGSPWWDWHMSAFLDLGDVLSGNGRIGYNPDVNQLFIHTITASNNIMTYAWTGLYNEIAQCNTTIVGIQQNAPSTVSATDKNAAFAEARFMRGVAYFDLAVAWGDVPIVVDNSALIKNPLLNRIIVSDVYKFVVNDLTYAAQNLPTTDVAGRVTTWSAQGMLAKVYLTMSGLGQTDGTRNQAYLDSAKIYAGNVCKNSGKELYASYYNLFSPKFNDVPEDLFALQWKAGAGYGGGNTLNNYAPTTTIMPYKGGAWGSIAPTIDLYALYTPQDSIRRKATMMLNGDYYPELNAAGGGYKSTGQSMKKHIVGNEVDNSAPLMDLWSSPEHDAILRLADVYLIYAEAILGNNASTTDADALLYFNKVRARAGVDPVASLDIDVIYRERRIEFAFEGQYWTDLVRLSYYNPQKAIDIVNNQQRVTFKYDPVLGLATPTAAGDDGGPVTFQPATISSFSMPLPASELTADPKLADAPVPYYK